MSDLIERLRQTASKGVSVWGDLMLEAAQEIAALCAALAQPEADIEQAVAAEREACAKMLDVKVYGDEYATALLNSYADDIRARGEVDYE